MEVVSKVMGQEKGSDAESKVQRSRKWLSSKTLQEGAPGRTRRRAGRGWCLESALRRRREGEALPNERVKNWPSEHSREWTSKQKCERNSSLYKVLWTGIQMEDSETRNKPQWIRPPRWQWGEGRWKVEGGETVMEPDFRKPRFSQYTVCYTKMIKIKLSNLST